MNYQAIMITYKVITQYSLASYSSSVIVIVLTLVLLWYLSFSPAYYLHLIYWTIISVVTKNCINLQFNSKPISAIKGDKYWEDFWNVK